MKITMRFIGIISLLAFAFIAQASIQVINLGTSPTGVSGDTARTAFTKANDNFAFLNDSLTNLNWALTNYAGTNVPSGGVTNNTSIQGGGNVAVITNGINDFTLTVPNFWLLLPTNTASDGQTIQSVGTNSIWVTVRRQEWAYAPSSSPWTPTFDSVTNHVYTLTNNSTINIPTTATNGNVSILCKGPISVSFTGKAITWGTANSPPTTCTNAVIGFTGYGPDIVAGYKETL